MLGVYCCNWFIIGWSIWSRSINVFIARSNERKAEAFADYLENIYQPNEGQFGKITEIDVVVREAK